MPPRTPLWGAAAGLMATPRPRPPWLSPLFLLHLPPEERLAHTGDSQRAGKGHVIGRPPPSARHALSTAPTLASLWPRLPGTAELPAGGLA